MSTIGSTRRDAAALFQRFGLAPFRQLLPSELFQQLAQQCACAPRRPTRCILRPEVVSWLMMYVALLGQSMIVGLQQAWGLLQGAFPHLDGQPAVREEAFCQARQRLPRAFWKALWRRLQERYAQQADAQLRLWGRYRPLAVDGTLVELPPAPALQQHFGRAANQHSRGRRPQARLVALCSILTGFCRDFVLAPLRCSEHQCLRHLIRHLQPEDLLLLDAGFFSYAALVAIPARGAQYLMRVSAQVQAYAQRLEQLGENDWQVAFTPSPASRRKHPGLPAQILARLIRYQIPGFRPAWLLTSLSDPQQRPAEELVSLYHRRWQIETIYREWKHVLAIQNLRSQSVLGIHKELYAHLMLYNLIRWVMTEATAGSALCPVQLSFTGCLQQLLAILPRLSWVPPEQWPGVYQRLLERLRACRILQRPGRTYPRRHDGRVKNKGHGKTKLPAKLPSP